MKTHFTDEQEIRGRFDHPGIDHGSDSKILVRIGAGRKAVRLMWEGGSTHFVSRGTQGYSPAELTVAKPGRYDDRLPHCTTIFKGGRLSKKRIHEHREQIAELLRVPVSVIEQIDPKRTLVVERTPDSPVLREMRVCEQMANTAMRMQKEGRDEDLAVALETLRDKLRATIYKADTGQLLTDAEAEAKLAAATPTQ